MTDGRELDAEHAARALLARGSIREGIALLRGAVARDSEEEGCAALLREAIAGRLPTEASDKDVIALPLVDRWIRRGMLVEALAVLSGTPMASEETGREWANLLGELLAPVPVDAEETLVEMHKQLLTGGASVALTLLDERAKREPILPAWATRRLEVLRWMLLDNAGTAESHPVLSGEAPTAFAVAIRDAVNRRDLMAALAAAREFARAEPDDPSPPRVERAIEAILAEIERHREDGLLSSRTMPMFGHPAAAMQLRMGNIAQAGVVYKKLLDKNRSDAHSADMLEHIEALMRSTRGEPAALPDVDDTTIGGQREEGADLAIPVTSINALPPSMARAAPEKSGPVPVGNLPNVPEGVSFDDEETTTQLPSAQDEAERLAAAGNLEEAEGIYRALAEAQPDNVQWHRRAEEMKAMREGRSSDVLVRVILPVE
jgi:hypothetical protein